DPRVLPGRRQPLDLDRDVGHLPGHPAAVHALDQRAVQERPGERLLLELALHEPGRPVRRDRPADRLDHPPRQPRPVLLRHPAPPTPIATTCRRCRVSQLLVWTASPARPSPCCGTPADRPGARTSTRMRVSSLFTNTGAVNPRSVAAPAAGASCTGRWTTSLA